MFTAKKHLKGSGTTVREDLTQPRMKVLRAAVDRFGEKCVWTIDGIIMIQRGGMLVVSVSVAGLVTLAAMTQPALAPEAKHTLLQYVTGKYLLPGNCKVNFEWEEPQVVGETMTFTVKFYQRNGQPYPICDTDNLFVEVTEGARRVATIAELGGTDPSAANVAVVKFTVRHAGQYRISVLIGSCHVQGSPFVKHFLPGPPDPNKTVFVRHSSTVVCTAGTPHSLTIEPRDEFNNLCQFKPEDDPTQGYTMSVTQFHFQSTNNQYSQPSFIVDDGCQPKVELIAKDRNVIAATFTHFLLKNIGGSETFKDKQDFFYHEVRKYHQKHYHEKLPMKIQREKLLESSLKATKSFSVCDWCRNFEITFQGEQGLDWGGVRREWFELVCAALFDARNCLFVGFSESQQALVHPNPHRPPHLKLKHYEFAGRLVGKCLYESALGGSYRQLVRARFTRSFLAQIIGLRVHYKYFEQDDPDLYLSKVKYILEHDVEDMELYFVEEEYDRSGQLLKVVELVPGGSKIHVRNSTKHQYLDALAQYRLTTCLKDEIEHFLKGLNELIPDNLLSIFDENELELLLCGTGEYSVADFRAHHVVNGGSPEFRRILDWFWTAVANFTQEEMARLLQFTTGCSQLPPGGFVELSPRFQITAAPTFGNLPTAHTCFNQLCLPDYESYEQFEKALLLAISEGTEGFGMI